MDIWTLGIPTPVALAIVTLIAYMVGRAQRTNASYDNDTSRRELKRAKAVIRKLENVADDVRRHLALHQSNVHRFKKRVDDLNGENFNTDLKKLCEEAEVMLSPTLKLATQIAHAYDEIRQQSSLLMSFTEARTDALTGLSNRRALDDSLETMFSMMVRYHSSFTVAIFDIDYFKQVNDQEGHVRGDEVLIEVAKLLDYHVRETDILARYGGEEFVVVMPETDLFGASVFANRVRKAIADKLTVTVSGGIAQALDGDNPRTLVARADAALYSAKAAGRNCVYRHTGKFLEPLSTSEEAPAASAEQENESETVGQDPSWQETLG
jgi:diguanylate cyclase